MKYSFCLIAFCLGFFCSLAGQPRGDTVCILQLNDVYEIGPLSQGRVGGMARVATIIRQHRERYQTFVVLAGDFVSPSVIGTTKIDGSRVSGRHMVDLMNKVGVDLVTFGNHEFDIAEADLQKRINESTFGWVSSDVLHADSTGAVGPFVKAGADTTAIPTWYLLEGPEPGLKIGVISATITSNRQPWVQYSDRRRSMKKAWKQARRRSDLVLALTHLSLAEDEEVLRKLKRIPLVMGGHEHEHNYVTVRRGAIAKADANAKTMYRHLLYREGRRQKIRIVSELVNVDSTVQPDPVIASAVKEWEDRAYASFRSAGLEPGAVVYHAREPLDGTEAGIRGRQTNLGNLIAQAMLAASPQADAALFNSGSVRIDDMIDGVITQLDVIRVLPFGGKICEADLDGATLSKLLATSDQIRGTGGYLQLSHNLGYDTNGATLNGVAIDPLKSYKIVAPEFLLSGSEKGLEFIKEGSPGILSVKHFDAQGDLHTDIRLAVVKYWSGIDGK
jgi:2',3'-cyclic-nucleotide 2'-phosphodiesterase (5'-nucleotidase family)